MPTTQENHILHVQTPLGDDAILLSSFSGSEALSRLFTYHLNLLSEKESIAPNDIVGKNITWNIKFKNGSPRYFSGFVSRFSGGGISPRKLRSYKAEVVPWLWFLTRTANCKIFQNLSTPDIIKKVVDSFGFTSMVDASLKATYPKREYCVQYRETAFNFVSRLMEEEGIFYFFRHEEGKHTLVLADQKTAYEKLQENAVDSFEHQYEYRPGKWTRTDYNFETPSLNLLTSTNTVLELPNVAKYEMFDYPGDYKIKANGTNGTKVRMEEEETPYEIGTGTSECYTFTPGGKFSVEDHDVADESGKSYVITHIQHTATDGDIEAGTALADYRNSFQCIPDTVTFRPARLTPKPLIAGTQPAVVVGKAGEEIYTDKYGRIKVQFFWDRDGKKDENSTCWIRVAQVWAGKRWGASFWPRIGQEVVVAFLEGDPDQPLVIGSVYNAEQMPPYQGEGLDDKHASDNKVSGIKSNSTKEGKGFNEWRFDDTKDKEQFYLHAQRNLDLRVHNGAMERFIGNRNLLVGGKNQSDDSGNFQEGGDQREQVMQDKHLHIMRHQIEQIEGNLQLTVGEGAAQDGGNVNILIEKQKTETIGGGSDLHVTKAGNLQIDGDSGVTVGGSHAEKIGKNLSLNISQNKDEKVGQNYALGAGQVIHIKAGQTLVLEAGTQLSLKVGGNFIDIGPAGVSIVGTMVMINSGGSPASGADASPQAPAAPQDATQAKPTKPDVADLSKSGFKSCK